MTIRKNIRLAACDLRHLFEAAEDRGGDLDLTGLISTPAQLLLAFELSGAFPSVRVVCRDLPPRFARFLKYAPPTFHS